MQTAVIGYCNPIYIGILTIKNKFFNYFILSQSTAIIIGYIPISKTYILVKIIILVLKNMRFCCMLKQ